MPKFSRDALSMFNHFVEDSGQVVEYVRGVSGFRTSYELNINDDTPLHLIALLHHYNATLDDEWIASILPIVIRVADYLLAQRDQNGLIFCNAKGVDMYGITSWRNIIPYYTLDGAVTEINAEAVFALEAAATLCAVCHDHEHWSAYSRGSADAAREDARAPVQRRHQRVRLELRRESELPGQLHRRRDLPGPVRGRQSPSSAARS